MGITSNFHLETDTSQPWSFSCWLLLWPLYMLSQKLNHTTEDILVDTDMAAMVITLERDLLMRTAITEDILVDTDMVVMAITLERDLLVLTAIMEDILEDTDTEVMDITLERDLRNPSHTTA